jgi:hypothetical protein
MRPVETRGDEERTFPAFLEESDGFRRHLTIGVLLVSRGGRVVRQRAAKSAARREIGDLSLFVLVDPSRIDEHLPRRRIVQTAGADVPRVPVVVNLADACHEVGVASEHLRQGHDVRQHGAKICLQIVHAGGIGSQTGQE